VDNREPTFLEKLNKLPRMYNTPINAEKILTLPINGKYYKILEVTLDKLFLSGSWIEALAEFQVTNDLDQQVGFFSKIILQSSTKLDELGGLMITHSNGGNSTHDSDHHHQITKAGFVAVPDTKLDYNRVQLWCKAVWTATMDGSSSGVVDLNYGQMCVRQWFPSELQ
jgi:hypothetical protein